MIFKITKVTFSILNGLQWAGPPSQCFFMAFPVLTLPFNEASPSQIQLRKSQNLYSFILLRITKVTISFLNGLQWAGRPSQCFFTAFPVLTSPFNEASPPPLQLRIIFQQSENLCQKVNFPPAVYNFLANYIKVSIKHGMAQWNMTLSEYSTHYE